MKPILFVAVFVVLSSSLFAQAPPLPPGIVNPAIPAQTVIKVSPETTYVVEPLDLYGFPNYLEFLNRHLATGLLRPEENAAVDLLKIVGPNAPEFSNNEIYFWNLCNALNYTPEEGEDYFVNWPTYLKRVDPKIADLGMEDFAAILKTYPNEKPWRSADDERLAGWLKLESTQRALTLLEEMTSRERFFMPYAANNSSGEMQNVSTIILPWVSPMRDLARLLQTQIMLDLGEQRFELASKRIIQLHKLGRLQTQQGCAVEKLVGNAIIQSASRCDIQLANSADATKEILEQHQSALKELGPVPDMTAAFSLSARMMALNFICLIAEMKTPRFENFPELKKERAGDLNDVTPAMNQLMDNDVDYNIALGVVNDYFNQLLDVVRRPYLERKVGWEKLNKEFAPSDLTERQIKKLSAEESGKLFGQQTVRQYNIFNHAIDAYDRTLMKADLVQLCFALQRYRKDHSKYPAKLTELAPKYLEAIPANRFSNDPLHYEVKEGEFKLFATSVGNEVTGAITSSLTVTSANWSEAK